MSLRDEIERSSEALFPGPLHEYTAELCDGMVRICDGQGQPVLWMSEEAFWRLREEGESNLTDPTT